MSDPILIAIISSLPGVLIGVAALVKIFKVHQELNSRLDEWQDETKKATQASNKAAKAEGVKEGKAKRK